MSQYKETTVHNHIGVVTYWGASKRWNTIFAVFPERVWRRLQTEGADRGERLQHVRVSWVEEQEAADVCGSERPRQANERKENAQEEHSHPLPPNYGVNWRAHLEWEQPHTALDREDFNT